MSQVVLFQYFQEEEILLKSHHPAHLLLMLFY